MIKTIKITNFQSHKDSTLNLHKGINVFTGPTNNGKTAIVRLLNWVVNNEPGGESFRSNWGGETSGTIITDESICVTRIKDKGKNLYVLGFAGLDEIYKSFGQGVPVEISESLNILPINIQSQMDPPFMLSQTPGEVARYLNEIVNLKDIDISVYNLNKEHRENVQKLSNLKSQLHAQNETLKKYRWIRSTDIKLKRFEKLEQEVKDIQERKNNLTLLLVNLKETNNKLDQFPDIKLMKKKVISLDQLMAEIKELKNKKENLFDLIVEIKKSNRRLQQFTNLQLIGCKINNLDKSLVNLNELKNKKIKLFDLLAEIKESCHISKNTERELCILKEKFNDEFPNICPLCDQEVKT